ncbi:ABC-type sugar transport system substrate-binding protein [Bradyrhizobium sp. GM7.3]
MTAFRMGRRRFLLATLAVISAHRAADAESRRFRVAFANLNEEPGTRIDGLGFTGAEIRRSFELASRSLPLNMIYYDNGGDADKAVVNARDAVSKNVDLLIEYNSDAKANAEIGRQLKTAGIPFLAVNYSIPGAPLYAADNISRQAGSPAKPSANSPKRPGPIRPWSQQSSATSPIRALPSPRAFGV